MHLINVYKYISNISEYYTKNSEINYASLDILEQFAWQKSLSAYQICSNLKSTHLKLAYKNVNKRVNALLLSGLIQETKINELNNKHNAKYYWLTEYGIFQLFLNRLHSLLVNQSDVRKGRDPSSNTLNFFRNYSNSILFKIFLYPYFEKDTISTVGDYLLLRLYRYLSSCCRSTQDYLKYRKGTDIPFVDRVFSWNQVPGKDNELLCLHLKNKFNLESIEPCDIEKAETDEEHPTITVKTSSAPVIIRLDKARNKVVIMSNANGEYKEFQYDVRRLGGEMLIGNLIPAEEPMKRIVDDAEKQIEQLIYEFVYDLASSTTDSKISNESSYYFETLSRDPKFMKAVKKIYENRHKGFERGCELLKYSVKRQ